VNLTPFEIEVPFEIGQSLLDFVRHDGNGTSRSGTPVQGSSNRRMDHFKFRGLAQSGGWRFP